MSPAEEQKPPSPAAGCPRSPLRGGSACGSAQALGVEEQRSLTSGDLPSSQESCRVAESGREGRQETAAVMNRCPGCPRRPGRGQGRLLGQPDGMLRGTPPPRESSESERRGALPRREHTAHLGQGGGERAGPPSPQETARHSALLGRGSPSESHTVSFSSKSNFWLLPDGWALAGCWEREGGSPSPSQPHREEGSVS